MRVKDLDCTVEGCPKKQAAKGLCGRHYMLKKRNGSPLIQVQSTAGTLMKWLKEVAMAYMGDECLKFPFPVPHHGYGQIKIGPRHYGVHRLVCEWVHGPPPSEDMEATHSCGNGHLSCVTRNHLRWKTPKENSAERFEHQRLKIGRYSESNAS